MAYLASKNILISYPNVERIAEGRSIVTSEQNITNQVCSLTPDSKGTFILSSSYGNNTDGFYIQFYIKGYYFDIVIPAGSDFANFVYVDIVLTTPTGTTTYKDYEELQGIDDTTGNYTGLNFYSTNPDGSRMQLLLQEGATYTINSELVLKQLWYTTIKEQVKPFFIDEQDTNSEKPMNYPTYTDRIWIDSTNNYIMRVFDDVSSTWIKLGAVYK